MSDGTREPRHGLREAFVFAFQGMRYAIRTQRTFRIHLAIAAAIVVLAIWLPLPPVEAAVVVMAVAIVLAAELFNTGVEAMVDLFVENNHHRLAKIAKDVAAAAVLLTAVAAAVVGTVILGPPVGAAVGLPPEVAASIARAAALILVIAGAAGLIRLFRRGPVPPHPYH